MPGDSKSSDGRGDFVTCQCCFKVHMPVRAAAAHSVLLPLSRRRAEPLLPIAAAPLAAPAISEQGSHLQQPEHPTSVTVTVQPPCAGVGTLHTTTADTHAESAEQRNERTVWATAAVPYIYWLRFSVLKMVIGMLYLDPLYSAGGLCGVIGAGTFLAQPRSKLRLAQAFVVGLAMMGAAGILFTLKMVKLLQLVFAVGM